MSYYRFKKDDVLHNTIKAHPQVNFFIYSGSSYYNNKPIISGAFQSNATHTETGHISLYELNVDRPYTAASEIAGSEPFELFGDLIWQPDINTPLTTGKVKSFIVKDGHNFGFKTISTEGWNTKLYGNVYFNNYPLSATITKHYFSESNAIQLEGAYVPFGAEYGTWSTPEQLAAMGYYHASQSTKRLVTALENTLNHYAKISPHYQYSSSLGDKGYQELGLIDVPSIFFGSSIKKGSVNLKYYITGTLIGQLHDRNHNGELVEVSGTNEWYRNKTAGVVLYNEGLILLTGSWDLSSGSHLENMVGHQATANSVPKWVHFGASMSSSVRAHSSSFELAFQGTSYIPTITMMAHARKGQLNYSNNPTFLSWSAPPQVETIVSGSTYFEEPPDMVIKNIASSSHPFHTSSFERITYVSKIGIYDENRNLLGVAKLANPVRKREIDEYTFKLKLDF